MIDIRHQLKQAASDEGVPLRTDVRQLLERARADRRRHRTRTAAFAAIPAVAVLAAGGVLGTSLLPADSGRSGDPADAPSVTTSHSPNHRLKSDPGLSPTAANLYQVLVTADGWTFDGMDNSKEWGGSQYWANGGQWLEVQWYPASHYDTYLRDRRVGTIERAVDLLGQSGLEFTEKPVPASSENGNPDQPSPSSMALGGPGSIAAPGHRVYTILPAVGDYFLMIDAYTTDKAAFDQVIGSLTRVDKATWERAIDRAVVTEAEGEAFLAEAMRGVPLPEGVNVTVDDLDLPQSPYQARAAFAGPVLCGWAEQYVAGDQQALETLRDSRGWPVLQAMRPEGEYAEVVAGTIERLADGTTDKGKPFTLELFDQAVGC